MTVSEYESVKQSFHDHLDDLQFNQSLDDGRFFVVDLEPMPLGPLISHMMLGLQLGHILNRCVVFRSRDSTAADRFFEPFSSVTYDEITEFPCVKASFDIEQIEKVVHFDFADFWANHKLRRYFYPWAPTGFASLHCGRLIFDGEILSRFKLTDEYQRQVDAAKTELAMEQPVIGLDAHERNAPNGTPPIPPEMLLERVESICEKHGVNRILVAGDPHSVTNGQTSDLDCDYVRIPGFEAAGLNEESIQPQKPLRDLLELETLSSCDWIVGRQHSDIARHAAARIGVGLFRCDRHSLVSGLPEKSRFRRILGGQS